MSCSFKLGLVYSQVMKVASGKKKRILNLIVYVFTNKITTRILSIGFFALYVGFSMTNQRTAAFRLIGVYFICGALYNLRHPCVPYGIRGQPPAGYLRGIYAVIFDIVIFIIGLYFIVSPELAKEIYAYMHS